SGNLEYLVCSLPLLQFSANEDIKRRTLQTFTFYYGKPVEQEQVLTVLNEICFPFLSQEQQSIFSSLHYYDDTLICEIPTGVLNDYYTALDELKTKLMQFRIQRKNSKQTKDESVLGLSGTPLEQEIQLMKLQWTLLDDIDTVDFASFEALCIYKLRLMILLRYWSFSEERGFTLLLESTNPYRKGGNHVG
ncbi:MAG: hypothetical protein SNJ71_04250, partial [Bacteroidales bacterium]